MTEKKKNRKKVKSLIERVLKQKGAMHDMAIHTKIVMSLSKEEMMAWFRYHDMVTFISGISAYDDILFILAKDKSKICKKNI